MNLDDLLRTSLQAEAGSAEPAPDAWDRIAARARESRHRRGRRGPVVTLAAAVAVVAATVWVAVSLRPERDDRVIVTPPATTGRPTTAPPPTVPPAPPRRLAAATTDGRVVLLDASTGAEVRQVAVHDFRDPGGERTTPVALSGVSLAPDGTVFYSSCCEPVSGSLYREGQRVNDGHRPAVSPDGRTVAVAEAVLGVKLVDGGGRTVRVIERVADRPPSVATSVAWSPDGSRLAVEMDGVVVLVPATAATLAEGRTLVPPAGRSWVSPVFRHDGSLLVIETIGSGPGVVRPVAPDGTSGPPIPVDRPARLAADASGGWVLVTTSGGWVVIGPDGSVATGPVRPGLVAADW
jgi:hypothetical protein